jgi:hypothetical protein
MSPVSWVPTYHHRTNERGAEVKAAWFPTMSNRNRRPNPATNDNPRLGDHPLWDIHLRPLLAMNDNAIVGSLIGHIPTYFYAGARFYLLASVSMATMTAATATPAATAVTDIVATSATP